MPDIVAVFPTVVFQIMDNGIVMRVASEVGTGLREVLRGRLGETIVPSSGVTKKQTDSMVSLTWRDGNLRITHAPLEGNVHRYDFMWTSGKPSKLVDSLELSGAHWYGGAQVRKMVWPMEKMKFKTSPFVAGDSYKEGEWGGVQERYWLSSKGIGVFVKPDVPLHMGLNESADGKLRLVAKYDSPYRNNCGSPLQLRYSIYHGPDIMTTHRTVMREMIPKPTDIPDLTMFRLPLWSTWSICKEDVDQEKVLLLAKQIKSYGINTAHLEIDDHWATHRGDWEFNREKFPNPREMIRQLNDMAFRVNIWVHPFANMKSAAIKKTELFVKGSARGAVKWWNGIGRVVDITNPVCVEWYKSELSRLKENYALASFKFDGGEAIWLPNKWSLHKQTNNPNMYTKKYAELAYEMDKQFKSVEVRVGVRTQKLPIFVRMMDKDSVWGEKNGLKTIIPQALLYGLIGFPFFIPDMVGGNAYDMDRPTKSLFIRWVQVCTFMPSIQFSLPPWWFDNQTVRITKKMLALRAKYTDLLIELAKEATKTGEPIIRPLWWIAPEDDFALKCDDQFLVGNDLLVAPVLTKGAKTRPLYLPAGRWRDEKSGHVLHGNKWYFEYKVTIEDLPHFTRLKEDPPLVELDDDRTVPLVPVPVPQSPEVKPDETPELVPKEPEVTPTEPEVAPTEPEVTPMEPEVAPTEPVVAPTEPVVAPTEPVVVPIVPVVVPAKPEDAPTEPVVAPTEPEVAPTEPVVAPTEPVVVPIVPVVVPAKPEDAPTEPVVAPTEPEVTPTEPEVAPTEPEVTPMEPEVAPTEPVVAPTEPVVVPIVPVVVPTKPEDAPTEPVIKPTEPEVVPTAPEVVPTKPEVAPTEPEVVPVKPEVAPMEPEVTPTEPEVVPAEPEVILEPEPELTPEPEAPQEVPLVMIEPAEPTLDIETPLVPVTGVTEAMKKLSASVDDLSVPDDYDSPDEAELPPPPPHTADVTEEAVVAAPSPIAMAGVSVPADDPTEEPDLGGALGSLLRQKLKAEVDEMGSDDELADMLRGKYRFSNLDEDIDDEFLAELAEIASSAGSVDTPDDGVGDELISSDDEDNEFLVRDTDEIVREMAYMLAQKSVDLQPEAPSAEPGEVKKLKVPLATQETLSEEQPGDDDPVGLDEPDKVPAAEAPAALDAAGLLGGLAGTLDQIVPPAPKKENKIMAALAGAVGDDLDAAMPPPPPARSTSLAKSKTTGVASGLYENVDIVEPAAPPSAVVMRQKRAPQPAPPRKSTLWDELTDKLKDMPKFDPEFEVPAQAGGKSVSVQVSFDETDTDGKSKKTNLSTQTSI